MKLKAGLLLNASLRICPLTFINGALCLSGSPFVASTASLSFLWQAFMMCCVNLATPIHFINGKCYYEEEVWLDSKGNAIDRLLHQSSIIITSISTN